MAQLRTLTQTGFRIRNDDGTETTATWKVALNTNASIAVGTNFRVRFAIVVSTGGSEVNTEARCFAYNLNGAGFVQITSSSTVVKLSASSHVSDETSTTQQISSGTFTAGDVLTSSTNTTNTDDNAATIEDEGCFQINSSAVNNGDTIVIEGADAGGGTFSGGYTQTCTITVIKGSARRRCPVIIF